MMEVILNVLEYMLTLVSLDKMQNISIRNLGTGHFESYSSETGLSPLPDLCRLSYFHTVHMVLHISAVLFQ